MADVRLLILLPVLGALAVLLGPTRAARGLGGVAAGAALLVAIATVLAEPTAWTFAWVPALGLQLTIGIDGLAAPGVLVICLVGQVAAVVRGGTRGAIAGGLLLQATLLAMVLARDLGLLVGCHALLAPLVALGVAGGPGSDRLRAGPAAGLYLALGTAALAVAAGLLAVAHHDATGGRWELSYDALTQVLLPRGLELAVGGLILLAGALTLGLWPLHGWLVAAGAAAPTGPGLLIAGPVRWVGAYLLMRVWLPLAPGSAAAGALGLGVLAVVGGVVGGLCARAEADERRALLLATLTPTGLVALGLCGQHNEGAIGALVLATVVALGGAAGLLALAGGAPRRWAGLALVPAPGLAGCVGAALVLIGTARFTGLTLGGHGWPLAVAGGAALVLSVRAGREGHGAEDRHRRTDRWALAGALVLAAPLVALGAWPRPWLARISASGRAVVEAATLRRCLVAELGVTEPTRVPATLGACDEPLRTLTERARAATVSAEPVADAARAVPVEGVEPPAEDAG
mgnify:CR=1 FL=1